MKLKLITPEKLILDKNVESLTLPGVSGQMTVMDGHDILIAALKSGRLYFRYTGPDDKPVREDYEVGEGLVEVRRDTARVFVKKAGPTF